MPVPSVTQSYGENAVPPGAEKAANWPLSNAIGVPMLCQGDGEPDTLSVANASACRRFNVVGQVAIGMIVAVCFARNLAGANYLSELLLRVGSCRSAHEDRHAH